MNRKVMDFYLNYTTRDKEGKLKVHSLPKEWVELFKEAKVRPKELRDPETVVFLLTAMEDHLAGLSVGGGEEEEEEVVGEGLTEPGGELIVSDFMRESNPGLGLEEVDVLPVLFWARARVGYMKTHGEDLEIKEGLCFFLFLFVCFCF